MPPALLQPARLPLLDGFRFLAAVGIVGIHALVTADVISLANAMRFSVPFFTVATTFCCFLLVEKERPFGQFLKNRVTRILLIFVVWELLYFVARVFSQWLWTDEVLESLPWKGQAFHLWYLPFIFGWSLVSWRLAKLARCSQGLRWGVIFGSALAALGLCCFPELLTEFWPDNEALKSRLPFSDSINKTIVYWLWDILLTLPAALGAVLICAWRTTPGQQTLLLNQTKQNTLVGCIVFLVATYYQVAYGRNLAAENLTGLGLLLIAFGHWNSHCPAWFAKLGKLSYGMYLLHLFLTGGLATLVYCSSLEPSFLLHVTLFVVATVACGVLVYLALKTRLGRFLLGD